MKRDYQSNQDAVESHLPEADDVAVRRVSASKVITFRQLIEQQYLAKGFVFKDVLSIIRLGTRVSDGSIRAAYAGTRVTADTAERLCQWAASTHRATLDVLVMYRAPTKKRMWRGATAVLARQQPANDNAGSAGVLRSLTLAGIKEPASEGSPRRIYVVLSTEADHELEDVEAALRGALGGSNG